MQRDSFIFYRSFFEATKPLNTDQKAQLYDAICIYSLEQETISLDPICLAMFALIKPQLEANHRRYLNGTKKKQTISKAEAKPKQTISKKQANVNVNVNDNVNVKEKVTAHTSFKHLKLSFNEFDKLKNDYGKAKVIDVLEQIENFKGNTKYTSLYLTAKQWLKRRENDKPANNKPSNFDQERAFGISL
tara:strand:- start:40 stop:606 length:567 start_codon:yes stop_codon:yes gene_type:complete